MAEFEIIGDEHTAGGDDEMDEATRRFLEEEQAQLAAMGVDPGFGEVNDGQDDDFGGFSGQDAIPDGGDLDEGFGGESQMANARDFGDDSGAFGGNPFGESSASYDSAHMMGGPDYGALDAAAQFGGSDMHLASSSRLESTGIFGQDELDEPESVRKWRAAMAARVAEVDARSAEKKEAMLQKAREDLSAFYTNFDHQKEVTAAANREHEAAFQASRNEPTGADWELVCGLCDFNPKTQVGQRDKSRMRGVLLQLKQAPLVR